MPKRVLIAPDKFKSCLTAAEVADALACGLLSVLADLYIDLCPMADGGEGTVDALLSATKGRRLSHVVTGPLPEMKVSACFGLLGDRTTAVIEMAEASGLHLLTESQRDPLATTTFGTGQLMMEAVRHGARRMILGIGGSATCDAGIGCAQACGLPVLLAGGEPTFDTEPLCGRDMDRVLFVKHARGSPIDGIAITVACDVTNPLFGPNGAACIFSPQKGAAPEVVRRLDASLEALARRLGLLDEARLPGSGAAGGLGFGLRAFFGAALQSGFDIVADATGLHRRISQADLVLTGEGKLDGQSLSGKTAVGVGRLCAELGKPCIAVAGVVESAPAVFRSTHALGDLAASTADSMRLARPLLIRLAADQAEAWLTRPA